MTRKNTKALLSEAILPTQEHDMSYEERFPRSYAGKVAKERVESVIAEHGLTKARENVNILTENIYQGLPSGDYGRGDVRRMVMALAGVTVDANNRYVWEGHELK